MLSYSCRWAHTYKNISQGLWHSPSLSPHLHSNKKKKKKEGGGFRNCPSAQDGKFLAHSLSFPLPTQCSNSAIIRIKDSGKSIDSKFVR